MTRRSAVGLLVLGAASTACEPMTVDQGLVGRPAAGASDDPVLGPDVLLATTVLARERRMLELVQATLERHASLRTPLADTRSTHRRHVELLTGAVPEEVRPKEVRPEAGRPETGRSARRTSAVPSRPGEALARIARREDRLGRDTRAEAFAAQSGPFARLLSSLAAAAQQQSATLRAAADGRGSP